ncbi:Periplasmic thiol disulfide interchange protein DsbA [Enhygromyxa salina]|uniref:Periplasmic thiol disulfide interchange protein DsbA n=1 Tax=Enhygromyxa salina TaxID=215803 RepID=A0A0C1ZBC6_9BACT|nr:thioredoxin domain-containing protein [Enhygromyxa salina]KIG15009.1 Periplasmic thiol disulfide interchange protein DsbA [Enhygromyxa salina]
MKRFALQTLIAAGLLFGLGATATTGCVAPPPKSGAAQAGTGTFVTMDEVDASMNDKVTGDRYQITYEKDDLWHGAPDGALVTIVEYSDFQCPYCSRLANSLKQISEEYPDDVRVVFKQFPLPMHDRAKPASEAVLAAHAQGKGWELHDLIFENARQLSDDDLIRYAEQVGVPDMAKFKADLTGHTFGAKVDAEMEQGKKFGVGSTPSFFINGRPERGTKSPEQLKEMIEAEKVMAQALLDAGSKKSEIYARIMKAAKAERAAPERPANAAAKGKQQQQARPGKPDPAKNYAVPVDDRPAKGEAGALVTIIEYSDFECPYCRKVLPTLKQIEEKYGADVRVVFRQQPLPMHKEAGPAASAALAAHQQGKFWEMHDALFAKAETRGLNDAAYIEMAKQLGLDIDKFNADRKSPAIAELIAGDQKIAMQFGAGGTPAFFVNGRPLSGAQPFEAFDAVVSEELAKAKAYMEANKVEPEQLYEEMSKGWETEVKPPPIADHIRRDIDVSTLAGKGNLKNPKLTLVECSDFDCPYCTRGAELVKAVFEDPKYKDVTAFYFANFPLPMHKTAEAAHRAAIAAGNQGKFFEMHDLLFADRTKRTEGDFKAMAAQLGLDVDKFMTDWNSEATKQKIVDDKALCSKHGVSGTPNFFINGRSMRGAVPLQMAATAFDEELAGGFEAAAKAGDKPAEGAAKDEKAEKPAKVAKDKAEKEG